MTFTSFIRHKARQLQASCLKKETENLFAYTYRSVKAKFDNEKRT